jgi:hypothetical protein
MNSTIKKNKFISILGILAILFTLNLGSAFAAEPLTDISGHWAKEQIQSFVDNGYVQGYPNGTFKPDNDITRAEFMTIANKAFGFTEKAEISYTDVKAGSWYADTVAIAKAAGYINGYPNGTMKPDAPITREEAAVIVAKIDALTSNETAANTFTDGADLAAWSKGSIGACADAKIFNGYPNGSFQAASLIERGESVVALSKALAYKNAPVAVTATVTNITAGGFQLKLTPAVDGLTQSAVTLTHGDNNVTVSAITTTTTGAAYAVTADIEEGQTYKLNLVKDGYNFGTDVTFTVLTAQQVADHAAADAVTAKISALPNTADLTLENKDAVNEAKTAFDALTDPQKALISAETQTKLNDAIAKIGTLQTPATETGSGQ